MVAAYSAVKGDAMAAAALDVNTMQPRSFFCTCTAVLSLYRHHPSGSLVPKLCIELQMYCAQPRAQRSIMAYQRDISQGDSFRLRSNGSELAQVSQGAPSWPGSGV